MKQIFAILLFMLTAPFISAELITPILNNSVDSISIKSIMWGIDASTYWGVDRTQFDKAVKPFKDTKDSIIKDKTTIFLIMLIINDLEPLRKDQIKKYPDSIKASIYPSGIMNGKNDNGDPLEVRAKIEIFLNNGLTIKAFASATCLDILNYRYHIGLFSNIISYFQK